jgi:hypothetical protein
VGRTEFYSTQFRGARGVSSYKGEQAVPTPLQLPGLILHETVEAQLHKRQRRRSPALLKTQQDRALCV